MSREYISDPIEIMDSQIDRLVDQIEDGKTPCCVCGQLCDIENMVAATPSPTAPGACKDCFYTWETGDE
jgi:hypothetical protein